MSVQVLSPERGGEDPPEDFCISTDRYSNRAALKAQVLKESRRIKRWCYESRTGDYNNNNSSHENKIVFLCDACKKFELVGTIIVDQSVGVAKLKQHDELCSSAPPIPTMDEIVSCESLCAAAFSRINSLRGLTNADLKDLVKGEFGEYNVPSSTVSRWKQKLESLSNTVGLDDGFNKVHCVMQAFAEANPGTIVNMMRDSEKHFKSLCVVPMQSLNIVRYAARTYFSLDAAFTTKNGWKSQMFVLEMYDGNNAILPVAFGLYDVESIENYSHFLNLVTSLRIEENGVVVTLKDLLNQPSVIIATDRHTSLAPSVNNCLPEALHRYDYRHILDNMMKSFSGPIEPYLMNCHKARSEKAYMYHLQEWKSKNPKAAEYANAIEHDKWTTYKLCESEVHKAAALFDLTGSQAVESENNRFKVKEIRHQYPMLAMINFIKYYAELVHSHAAKGRKMETPLTSFASLKVGAAMTQAQGYTVTEGKFPKLEVVAKSDDFTRRTVRYVDLSIPSCSCQDLKLQKLPCRHIVAAYIQTRKTKKEITVEAMMDSLEPCIGSYYWKENYHKGYADNVAQPRLEVLQSDDTLPPVLPETKPRGQEAKKRKQSAVEGNGNHSRKRDRKFVTTQKNVRENGIEAAVRQVAAQPDRELRPNRPTTILGLLSNAVSYMTGSFFKSHSDK